MHTRKKKRTTKIQEHTAHRKTNWSTEDKFLNVIFPKFMIFNVVCNKQNDLFRVQTQQRINHFRQKIDEI